MKIKDLTKVVADTSNKFEENNSNIKKEYFIKNIEVFNRIASTINTSFGTFGTGYPFYALNEELEGNFPIISEQLRYNNELVEYSKESGNKEWICAGCLKENYDMLPDLKQVCKPCPNMEDTLKPRKIINRLPDLDMWIISKDGECSKTAQELSRLLELFNIYTSDVDPMRTIEDFTVISDEISNGIMPRKYLPIDTHIIESTKLKILINQIPSVMKYARDNNTIPYLPIHPISYRKKWQYDDEAYNFIFDFLFSFNLFSNDSDLNKIVRNVRFFIANKYSKEELLNIVYLIAPDSVKRRMETDSIRENLILKFLRWNKLKDVQHKLENDDMEK